MFHRILIANRGEIACRIIKTARSMGIHTVAIYSSVDKDSLHVRYADSAYYVGAALAKDSYLNIENIIHIARESQVDAIHPGYGFLSENPTFATACQAAGIVFIGPSIEALHVMASKQSAKQLLEKTQVPLTPGYHGNQQTEEQLLIEAKKIGFPVLIKAANGGGGKGMRSVHHEAEWSSALAGAKRESLAYFADDTLIIEQLILQPRHVELQILADNYGHVLHLFERDCSIQRRHQKIIEEAPAPNLSASLRQKLAQAACEVARSIKYSGVGTVEFLVDDAKEQFYFMEMNTRLQVEHPVTEMITGIDLVAWQLKIAAMERLSLTQDEIKVNGHAIECRIYAEDPYHDFIPSIGQIHFMQEPSGEGLRIDTGVEVSSHITMYYDPMIAKLILWGTNREEALCKMNRALSHYLISGVKTNIPFLQAITQHPQFKQAQLCTDFLSHNEITLKTPDHTIAILLAVSYDYLNTLNALSDPLLNDTFAWQSQLQALNQWIWRYNNADELVETRIQPINQRDFKVQFKEKEYVIHTYLSCTTLYVETNKQLYHARVEKNHHSLTLHTNEGPITVERFNWETWSTQATPHRGQLTAPMPATVVAILKNIGEKVTTGERLMVLEAMKMEHSIHAPHDGIIADIFYAVGTQVNEGDELVSLEESLDNSTHLATIAKLPRP